MKVTKPERWEWKQLGPYETEPPVGGRGKRFSMDEDPAYIKLTLAVFRNSGWLENLSRGALAIELAETLDYLTWPLFVNLGQPKTKEEALAAISELEEQGAHPHYTGPLRMAVCWWDATGWPEPDTDPDAP